MDSFSFYFLWCLTVASMIFFHRAIAERSRSNVRSGLWRDPEFVEGVCFLSRMEN